MVRAGEQDQESYRSKLFNFRGMFDSGGRHAKSLSVDTGSTMDLNQPIEDGAASSRSQGSKPLSDTDKIPKAKVVTKEEIAAKEVKDKLLLGSISDTNICVLKKIKTNIIYLFGIGLGPESVLLLKVSGSIISDIC
jgi:hypothetical protein